MDCGTCWSRMNKVFIKLWTKCFFNYPICFRAPVFLRVVAKTYYLITEGQVTVFFSEVTLFLTNPQKSNRRKFRRCRSWRVTLWSFTLLHLPPFQRHLELSSKIRSSLLYFSTAITFERFKTFCLHFSHAETETFTRERDLIPIGTLLNFTIKKK